MAPFQFRPQVSELETRDNPATPEGVFAALAATPFTAGYLQQVTSFAGLLNTPQIRQTVTQTLGALATINNTAIQSLSEALPDFQAAAPTNPAAGAAAGRIAGALQQAQQNNAFISLFQAVITRINTDAGGADRFGTFGQAGGGGAAGGTTAGGGQGGGFNFGGTGSGTTIGAGTTPGTPGGTSTGATTPGTGTGQNTSGSGTSPAGTGSTTPAGGTTTGGGTTATGAGTTGTGTTPGAAGV